MSGNLIKGNFQEYFKDHTKYITKAKTEIENSMKISSVNKPPISQVYSLLGSSRMLYVKDPIRPIESVSDGPCPTKGR